MHRGQEKRARQQFGDQSANRITNEHRVKPGPHKHCLTKQLKNNVHWASPNNLTNHACNGFLELFLIKKDCPTTMTTNQ